MRRRTASGPGSLTNLAALLLLGLSVVVVEVHTAAHPPGSSFTDLAVELSDHPAQAAHFGAPLGFLDLRCPACLASVHQRWADFERSATLSSFAEDRFSTVDGFPPAFSLFRRLPVSRGPPLL